MGKSTMELTRRGLKRVVVTGVGAVTALGHASEMKSALVAGHSGIRTLQGVALDRIGIHYGAQVLADVSSTLVSRKELRRMGKASRFALAAAIEAATDAGLTVPFDPTFGSRVATVFGTTLGAHELDEDNVIGYFGADTRVPTPSRTINALPNVPAHHVAKLFGANGYLATINTACAAGTQAIGIASDLIQLGHADLVIAGGVEAILNDYSIASFDAMGVLARGYNDAPDRASRPFEASRSGFVIGEGAAALVVESLEHAIRRNAQPLAEVLGYAAVSDGYHMAALDPTGDGIVRCMQQALSNSCVSADAVDLINAHGTGTLSNDSTETLAIKRVLGSRAYEVPVVSTKSMLGHALAASGAIEAIACIDSLQTGVMHPTINLDEADPACDLDYVPHTARQMLGLRVAMSNSFGLGGQNASILFGKR
jgi:3-oxoacyl-[acyl-carrier-protein] synthase II